MSIQPDSSTSEDDEPVCADFASIVSTLPDYIYQNGRRFHAHFSNKCVSTRLLCFHNVCRRC